MGIVDKVIKFFNEKKKKTEGYDLNFELNATIQPKAFQNSWEEVRPTIWERERERERELILTSPWDQEDRI